jgi:hypothetical protein
LAFDGQRWYEFQKHVHRGETEPFTPAQITTPSEGAPREAGGLHFLAVALAAAKKRQKLFWASMLNLLVAPGLGKNQREKGHFWTDTSEAPIAGGSKTMGLLEFALIVSIVIALYNFQQIKSILRDKGYVVSAFSGWLQDYRRFKGLIPKESDRKVQLKYQQILNGLLFSLIGVGLFAFMILRSYL